MNIGTPRGVSLNGQGSKKGLMPSRAGWGRGIWWGKPNRLSPKGISSLPCPELLGFAGLQESSFGGAASNWGFPIPGSSPLRGDRAPACRAVGSGPLFEAWVLPRSWVRARVCTRQKGVPSAPQGQKAGSAGTEEGALGAWVPPELLAQGLLLSPSRTCHSGDASLHEASPCHHRHAAGFHVPGELPLALRGVTCLA